MLVEDYYKQKAEREEFYRKAGYKRFPLGDWNEDYQHWGKPTWFEVIFKNATLRDILIRFARRNYWRGKIYKIMYNKLTRY